VEGRREGMMSRRSISRQVSKSIQHAFFPYLFIIYLMREDGRGKYFMLCDAFIINDMWCVTLKYCHKLWQKRPIYFMMH
jgi:hypothetical protein